MSNAIRHQWVKFKDGFDCPLYDYTAGDWVLVEIDDKFSVGGVSLFGVGYSIHQFDIETFGVLVDCPN